MSIICGQRRLWDQIDILSNKPFTHIISFADEFLFCVTKGLYHTFWVPRFAQFCKQCQELLFMLSLMCQCCLFPLFLNKSCHFSFTLQLQLWKSNRCLWPKNRILFLTNMTSAHRTVISEKKKIGYLFLNINRDNTDFIYWRT